MGEISHQLTIRDVDLNSLTYIYQQLRTVKKYYFLTLSFLYLHLIKTLLVIISIVPIRIVNKTLISILLKKNRH